MKKQGSKITLESEQNVKDIKGDTGGESDLVKTMREAIKNIISKKGPVLRPYNEEEAQRRKQGIESGDIVTGKVANHFFDMQLDHAIDLAREKDRHRRELVDEKKKYSRKGSRKRGPSKQKKSFDCWINGFSSDDLNKLLSTDIDTILVHYEEDLHSGNANTKISRSAFARYLAEFRKLQKVKLVHVSH